MRIQPFSIAEQDSSPIVWFPWQIQFPNGTVTDNGNGTVFINTGAGAGGTTYDVRTPLLVAGTVLSILTDGTTNNFLRGDGVYAAPPTGMAYAPSNATYILQTPDGVLTNEQALNQLITGLVKNTSGTGVLSIGSGGVDFENLVTVRSPVLRRIDVISFQTDGSTNFLRGDGTYRSVYEARSPLLSAGTVVSILTDGTTTNFLRGDGTYAAPAGGTGLTWAVATVDTTALVNKGYIVNSGGLLTVTLPVSAAIGDIVRVAGINGAWKVAQSALQQVFIGDTSTTAGVGGYLQSTDTRDAVELICVTINSSWNTLSAFGNIQFV